MTPPVPPRVAPHRAAPISVRRRTPSPRGAERLLRALGVDPAFADAVLGDLAEEYALRAERDGLGAARWWYARESLRSAPHLVRSAVRRAVLHGTPRERARLAAGIAAVALTLSVAVTAVLGRSGPPARLVAHTNDGGGGVVVNSLKPVQLSVRVLDADGHRLERGDVRYAWVSGAQVPVSATGVVTCARRGDAVVRATLAALVTNLVLRCEPVREVRGAGWGDFVVGDSARELALAAVGADGRPVKRVALRLLVADSTVVALDGTRLRPLRAGVTEVDVYVGDHWVPALVTVYEPVRTFERLRPDQHHVVAPVHLTQGASLRWPLPAGLFWLGFSSEPDTRARPALTVDGPVMCMPALSAAAPGPNRSHCLVRGAGATVTVAHPGAGAPPVAGALWLDWQRDR